MFPRSGLLALGLALGALTYAEKTPAVIGTLGQSIASTKIFRSMSRTGRVLTPIGPYRYLVINRTDDSDWLQVVMSDGSKGYVRSDQVALLPYEVTAGKPKADGSPTANVGSLSSRGTTPNRSTTGSLPAAPRAETSQSESSDPVMEAKQKAIQNSFHYIGTPYKWGGQSLTGGIDCSAFVQTLYGHEGINLPRTAREQARVGQKVERLEDLQPGDRLYFWSSKRGEIGHTGIFLGYFQDGGAYFIHSSSTNHGVATDDLRNPKWRRILVEARR